MADEVLDGESKGDDCDEVKNEVDGMKKGADSTGKVMHI